MSDFTDYLPEVWTERGWSVYSSSIDDNADKKPANKRVRRGDSWVQQLSLGAIVGFSLVTATMVVQAEISASTLSYFVAPKNTRADMGRVDELIQAMRDRSTAPFSKETIARAAKAASESPSTESPDQWAKRMTDIIVNARD
jgi:hypothetical protein